MWAVRTDKTQKFRLRNLQTFPLPIAAAPVLCPRNKASIVSQSSASWEGLRSGVHLGTPQKILKLGHTPPKKHEKKKTIKINSSSFLQGSMLFISVNNTKSREMNMLCFKTKRRLKSAQLFLNARVSFYHGNYDFGILEAEFTGSSVHPDSPFMLVSQVFFAIENAKCWSYGNHCQYFFISNMILINKNLSITLGCIKLPGKNGRFSISTGEPDFFHQYISSIFIFFSDLPSVHQEFLRRTRQRIDVSHPRLVIYMYIYGTWSKEWAPPTSKVK